MLETVSFTLTILDSVMIIDQGPHFWNSLPTELKSKSIFNSFKMMLKHYLINISNST